MKKGSILSLFLIVLALCAALAVPVGATGSGFTVEGGVLIKYTGSAGDMPIPVGIIRISERAFEGAGVSSVTCIDKYAFSEGRSLTTVNIPYSVASMGDHVVYK